MTDRATIAARPVLGDEQRLHLAGRPSLTEFVRYVQGHARHRPERGALVEEWQAARARITMLERTEAGAADHPHFTPLEKSYEPLLIEFFKNPLVRKSFNTVPVDIVLVPLDDLVVYQPHIDLTHVQRLRARWGRDLDEARVFQVCLPSQPSRAPVTWSGTRRGQFVFVSPSNDLRFLGAEAIEPAHLANAAQAGAFAGMVGLAVGFGSNFLNAFHAAGRLILNNGSHRAYALREAGVTHVPCVIQQVAGLEELGLVAADPVRRRPKLYLEHPRPPMLRDYFDPDLRTVIACPRRLRQVTVRFQVEETFIPALDVPEDPAL